MFCRRKRIVGDGGVVLLLVAVAVGDTGTPTEGRDNYTLG